MQSFMENRNNVNSFENDSLLNEWKKSELYKSLAQIEKGTIQFENWEMVRDRLFEQNNVK